MAKQSRLEPGPDDFLVLLVEDELVKRDLRDTLEQIEGVFVVEAEDVGSAIEKIDRFYIDAAVVDIKLKGVAGAGFEVLEKLRERAPHAPVVIATNHGGKPATMQKFVGSEQVVRVQRKSIEPIDQVAPPIEAAVKAWRSRRVDVSSGTFVRDLLWDRRRRHTYELRETRRELGRELDRLYRHLFGDVRSLEGAGEVEITFRPIPREGLSAAVTVEGEVTLGRDADDEPIRGNRCVVKIGPADEIREEVERYERFVKFGVPMTQRVELLSHGSAGALGGIAYSFAGGVFGQSLVSFDQLLRRPDGRKLAGESIDRLFDPDAKNWYAVRCETSPPLDYMQRAYGTDFEACFESLGESLEMLQRRYADRGISHTASGEDKVGSFLVEGVTMTIPPTNVSGTNTLYPRRPACLVHGDMHGGNVMIELEKVGDGKAVTPEQPGVLDGAELKRICLIDYRNAGPGPRAVDAVALQASIRLADAITIAEEVEPGGSERVLKGDSLRRAVMIAGNRVQGEEKWLAKSWAADPDGQSVASERSEAWVSTSARLSARMRFAFPDMTLAEYLSIAIPCAIRQFEYDVGPLVRVRMLAWLSALFSALEDEPEEA